MTQPTISDFSTTAASNADYNAVGILGTSLLSTADDAFRMLAAMLAGYSKDLAGIGQTVGGSANAITLTVAQPWAALANGLILAFKNTGGPNTSSVTLATTNSLSASLGTKAIRLQGDTALVGGELVANGVYLLRYDTAYNAAAGAWVLLNPQGITATSLATAAQALAATSTTIALTPANLAQERTLAGMGVVMVNGTLVTSVGASARTIAIKTLAGNDPSATDPVTIAFRDVALTTGGYTTLLLTAATSFVISSGSTMGFSNATPGRLWVVGFNDAGTFRLGAVNALSGTSIMALRDGIYSSTAEGGAGAADSAQVIYTGTAVTSKAMRLLGYIDVTETTAGTWAATPTNMVLFGPGIAKPGDIVQTPSNLISTFASGSTQIPADNTIPQSGEGDQYASQAITPSSASNLLLIEFNGFFHSSGSGFALGTALFQDSTASAIAATMFVGTTTGAILYLRHHMLAGTAVSTTFKIRVGSSTTGTTSFGGSSATRYYGAIPFASMSIREFMA